MSRSLYDHCSNLYNIASSYTVATIAMDKLGYINILTDMADSLSQLGYYIQIFKSNLNNEYIASLTIDGTEWERSFVADCRWEATFFAAEYILTQISYIDNYCNDTIIILLLDLDMDEDEELDELLRWAYVVEMAEVVENHEQSRRYTTSPVLADIVMESSNINQIENILVSYTKEHIFKKSVTT